MADMPTVRSRNMLSLMQAVVDTHQAIRSHIHEHAQELADIKAAENERMNAEAKLGPKRAIKR